MTLLISNSPGKVGEGIDRLVLFNYTSTQDALEINRQRIKERNEENEHCKFWH